MSDEKYEMPRAFSASRKALSLSVAKRFASAGVTSLSIAVSCMGRSLLCASTKVTPMSFENIGRLFRVEAVAQEPDIVINLHADAEIAHGCKGYLR